jgi:hypothetical protein
MLATYIQQLGAWLAKTEQIKLFLYEKIKGKEEATLKETR